MKTGESKMIKYCPTCANMLLGAEEARRLRRLPPRRAVGAHSFALRRLLARCLCAVEKSPGRDLRSFCQVCPYVYIMRTKVRPRSCSASALRHSQGGQQEHTTPGGGACSLSRANDSAHGAAAAVASGMPHSAAGVLQPAAGDQAGGAGARWGGGVERHAQDQR